MTPDNIQIPVVIEAGRLTALPPSQYTGTMPVDEATKGLYDPEVKGGGGVWAMWGGDDQEPTTRRTMIEDCDIAGATIGKLSELMWGDGIYWSADWNMKHKEGLTDQINSDIEEWLDRNMVETMWLPGQTADYRLLMNTFTEFWWDTKGKGAKTIAGMAHRPAEHCRLGYQDEKSGDIPFVVYSPDFGLGRTPADDRLALIDYWDWKKDDPAELVRGKNFIHHAYYPTPGMTYYANPFWSGLFKKGGWIDVSIGIPKMVSLYNANKMKVAYLINIPVNYFVARDPEFLTYDANKRKKIFDDEVARINSVLRDEKNHYASLISMYAEAEGTYTAYGKIEINPILQEANDAWMPDSNVSDSKIVQGLGMHPSQMGLMPQGGKMGAGSGSDQKESFNTQNVLNSVHQQILLYNLTSIVGKINGWGAKFWIGNERHVTQNIDKSGVISAAAQ